jgi:truncated hemoglobin YjbI
MLNPVNPWYLVAAGLLVAWAVGMAYYLWRTAPYDLPPDEPAPVEPAPVDYFEKPAPRPRDHVLHRAPRIGGDTLRDWLIHRYNRDGIWAEVVTKFFKAAEADNEIFAYFEHVDDMDEFQRHFLHTLLILTHTGLTVGALDAMEKRHAGLGITGPVFDRTVLALAGVLDAVGVPDSAVQQLLPAVSELRGVIVTA